LHAVPSLFFSVLAQAETDLAPMSLDLASWHSGEAKLEVTMELWHFAVQSVVGVKRENFIVILFDQNGLDGVITAEATVVASSKGECGGKKSNCE